MIQITPRNRIEEFARQEYARHFRDSGKPARVVNTGTVASLLEGDVLVYRGRPYHAPPVCYTEVIHLFEIAQQLADLAANAGDDPRTQMRAIATIQAAAIRRFPRLVKPVDWRRFIPSALRPNPFRSASPQEVDDLLGFFWKRQMKSSVRSQSRTGINHAR